MERFLVMWRAIRVLSVLLLLVFFANVLYASDVLLSMLEKEYDTPLTNDDVGRIFILNCDFSVRNGPIYYAGTHMVLRGGGVGCLICAPEGAPSSDEYKVSRTKLVRTPFFEGTPAQAYAQLVLEIFTAKDFYKADPQKRTPNPRARRKIFENIEFYLLAIPSTEETRKRIKCIQAILKGESLVLENYKDEINELIQREKRRKEREAAESRDKDNDSDSGGCFTCPYQRRLQVERRNRSSAKSSREDRLDIIKDCLDKLYGETETLVDDALSDHDITLAIAILLHVQNFTNDLLSISKKYTRKEIKDVTGQLEDIQKDLCTKISERMQDDGWADASKEYRERFSGVTLVFNMQTPQDSVALERLLNLSFQSYVGLYCVSPEADFSTWGSHCLNYLFFVSGTPWSKKVEDDYRQNLRAYQTLLNEGKSGAPEAQKK